MPKIALDEIDQRILDVLQTDGRLSNIALAERIGLSPTPCLRRVRRLEAQGLIKGYGALLDRHRVGFGLTAFVSVTIHSHSDKDAALFEDAILRCPQVVACHLVTGEADFLLEVVAPDLESYSHFMLTTLLKLPGMKDVHSNISMKAVKSPTVLPLDLVFGNEENGGAT